MRRDWSKRASEKGWRGEVGTANLSLIETLGRRLSSTSVHHLSACSSLSSSSLSLIKNLRGGPRCRCRKSSIGRISTFPQLTTISQPPNHVAFTASTAAVPLLHHSHVFSNQCSTKPARRRIQAIARIKIPLPFGANLCQSLWMDRSIMLHWGSNVRYQLSRRSSL